MGRTDSSIYLILQAIEMRHSMKTWRKKLQFTWDDRELSSFGTGRITLHANNVPSLDFSQVVREKVRRLVRLQVGHDLKMNSFTLEDVEYKFRARFSNCMNAT